MVTSCVKCSQFLVVPSIVDCQKFRITALICGCGHRQTLLGAPLPTKPQEYSDTR
jgi:hypothetical protein